MKRLLTIAFLMSAMMSWAQTDVTSYIEDPDFDVQQRSAWKTNGFGRQTNNSFPLKHGEAYREIWSGGTAMNAYLYQDVANLPVGTYTLTVTAQNIKQSDKDLVCTGAWIYANDQKTNINKPGEYTVTCVVKDGNLRVGAETKDCTGNYVCVDYFRLSYQLVYADVKDYLQDLLEKATQLDENDGTAARAELVAARDELKKLVDAESSDGLDAALKRLQQAMRQYRLSLASSERPMDMTEEVSNPGFESGTSGWTFVDMNTQSNTSFAGKVGNTYTEKWTSGGQGVGDGSALQTIKNLPNGLYRVTAVAQNIQQADPSARQTGCFIVAGTSATEVSTLDNYAVEAFTVTGQLTLGFKCLNATGNYCCVDNFKLYYIGTDEASEDAVFQTVIIKAEETAALQMNTEDKEALQQAIQLAKTIQGTEGRTEAALALESAMEKAQASHAYYVSMDKTIQRGRDALALGLAEGTSGINEAIANIEAAKASGQLDADKVKAADKAMDKAIFCYRVANGSGEAPQVTTFPTVIVGCNAMVGRLKATGGVKEAGFCWAEHPDPTVFDEHSSYNQSNGETNHQPVYVMYDVKASTEYWVRAYAVGNDYAVGYGEPVRVITLPQSDTQYTYLWNGDDDHNLWLDNAMREATAYYNTWTAIKGFRPTANYSPGTETADCSYGGWINVGPWRCNTGTMVHEMMHGTGVGQHGRWWDRNLHNLDEGVWWLGERGNRVTQFFEMDPANGNYRCNGDGMHVCFQGNGSDMQQIRSALLMQALYEDGLPAVSDGACPFYSFESIDSLYYFITNNQYGQTEQYLCENAEGKLVYSKVDGADHLLSDSTYAWRVLYDKMTGLYRIRNLKSGKYFNFSGSGVSLRDTETPGSDDQVQLMPARIMTDMKIGTAMFHAKPYWFARANRVCDPNVMAVNSETSTTVSSPVLDFSNTAYPQFWLILSKEQVAELDKAKSVLGTERLERLIKGSKEIAKSAHEETAAGANAAFDQMVKTIEGEKAGYVNVSQVQNAVNTLYKGLADYLGKIKPESPLDVTFLLDDPDLDNGSNWINIPEVQNGLINLTGNDVFECGQTIPVEMPKGAYGVLVRGFQRPGKVLTAMADYKKGNDNATAKVTIGNKIFALKHIYEGGQEKRINEGGRETKASGLYVPYDTAAARVYMEKGYYDNWIAFKQFKKFTMSVGFKNTTAVDDDWIVIGDVKIYYYGAKASTGDVTGIDEVEEADGQKAIYGVDGVRRDTMRRGINIVDGKKIIVR